MTNEVQQICSVYDRGDLSIDEVADAFSMDPLAIKSALLNGSKRYSAETRPLGKNDKTSNFSPSELTLAKEAMVRLLHSDDENVTLKASRYIIDDSSGRLDDKQRGKVTINVALFNEAINRARIAKENGMRKLIEV